MARLVREYRNILSIAIAQTQTEQASSPSMTAFTIQWACRNSAISDTSVDVSGRADCATSAGFICSILSTQDLSYEHARKTRRHAPAREPCLVSLGGPVRSRDLNPLPTCQNEGFSRVITPLTRR